MRRLDSAQLGAWERDGFLVLPGFVDPDACARLRQRADELVAAWDPSEATSVFSTREQTRTSDEYFLSSGDRIAFFLEEEAVDEDGRLVVPKPRAVNKIGHAMHDLDPVFDDFSHGERLARLAADVGFHDPVVIQSMYIFKQPGIGGEVTLHTDHTFLWTEPQSVVGFWFALEDATIENGAMWALPGGHRLPVRKRFRRAGPTDADGTTFEVFDDEPYPTDGLVPLEAEAGTLVLLHGSLPHASAANRSSRSRHAYTLHVIERGAQYPDDNWLARPDLPLRGLAG